MNKIYTVKEYEQAIEDREQIEEQFVEGEKRSGRQKKPLKRELAKLESAIATFAICTGKPAVSKGKPEYSWKRAKRCKMKLDKT